MIELRTQSTSEAAGVRSRSTALVTLQVFVWLVMILPARLVIGPIGAFGSPASIIGLTAFGMWVAGAIRGESLVRTVVPVRVALLAMWIPGLISFAVMHMHSMPGDEVNSADRWLLFMFSWSGIALLAAEGLRDRSEVIRLQRVAVAGAAVTAAIALVQNRTGIDATTLIARIPGLKVNGDLLAVIDRSGRRRAAGTATHPIELGTLLAMTLGPAIALALHDAEWSKRRRLTCVCVIALAVPISI
jgi:hypothetical protein